MFLKLGTRNVYHKRNKMTPVVPSPWQQLCRRSCFIKPNITRFYLKQGSSSPNNLMGRVKTTWISYVFWARPSVRFQRVANWHIWFFTERDWSQKCCHGNNTEGVILFLLWCTCVVPSLKNTAPIFLGIFLIQCFTVQVEPAMTS